MGFKPEDKLDINNPPNNKVRIKRMGNKASDKKLITTI